MTRPLVVAVTGASGVVYAVRLLQVLAQAGRVVHVSLSESARVVIAQELRLHVDLKSFSIDALLDAPLPYDGFALRPPLPPAPGAEFHYFHYQDFLAPMASGSFLTDGMVICPCSGATVSGIAHGSSANLIQRAADVHLKERRKLVLVPRETPLSLIQLDNMRRCVEAGAVMLPAMPGFYHGAQNVADLVDFVVARICDQLGVDASLMRRWGEAPGG